MKKMFVLFLFFVSVFGKATFANDPLNITRQAKSTFESEFPNARFAEWRQLKNADVYQVVFVYSDQRVISFIDADGKLLGFARSVFGERLPFHVSDVIAKAYGNCQVLSADVLVMGRDLSYIFSLQNEKFNIVLRLNVDGETELIKKSRR